MKYNELLNKMLAKASDSVIIIENLLNAGKASQIDIDVMKEKLRELYNATIIVEKEFCSTDNLIETKDETPHPPKQVKKKTVIVTPDDKSASPPDTALKKTGPGAAFGNEEIASPIAPQEENNEDVKKAVFKIEDYFKDVDEEFILPSKLKMQDEAIESFKTITNKPAAKEHQDSDLQSTASEPKAPEVIDATEEINPPEEIPNTEEAETKIELAEPAENEAKEKQDRRLLDFIASQKQEFKLAENLNRKPLANIKSGVGINDVFMFTKELFEGNRQHYIDVVSDLDSFASLEDALQYIHSNLQWDYEKPATKKFMTLLSRRFLN